MSDAATQERPQGGKTQSFPPFTVELGDECNRQFMLATLRITQLRGRWKRDNLYNRPDGAKGALAPGQLVSQIPDIPGMRLEVNCRPPASPENADCRGTVRIYDPLAEDPALLKALNQAMSGADSVAIKNTGQEWGPHAEVTHELDEHQLKTLLLEISRMVYGKSKSAFALPGSEVPTEKQLQSFAGRELYDLWNSGGDKPMFKEDVKEWNDRQSRIRATAR